MQLFLLFVQRVQLLLKLFVQLPGFLSFLFLILGRYRVNDPLLALDLRPDLVYVRKRPRVGRALAHYLTQFLLFYLLKLSMYSLSLGLYFRKLSGLNVSL